MQRKFVRIFLFALLSTACLSAAHADQSVTFTLSTPRYYKDGNVVFCDDIWSQPSFVTGKRGTFDVFQNAPKPTSSGYVANGVPAGYYVSKWELCTAGGGTVISPWEDVNNISITFDYKWAAKYGTWLELYVYISPMTYTVSYNANGGTWGYDPEVGPWKYSAGGTAPDASAVSRTGCSLTGWKSSTGKTLAPGAAFTGATLGVTANEQEITLTAQWSTESYTATIAAGTGGSGSSTVDYSYSEDQTQAKPITLPTREGHSISSWTASGHSGTAPTISGSTLTIPAKTYGNFTMTPTWQANTYALYLEVKPGIAKICYRLGSQAYYDETTESISVPADYGTTWSAYAVAVDGCTTNATCAASGMIGTGGAKFSPRVDATPYPLQLKPGKGIAAIYYKTNGTQTAWCGTSQTCVVPVLFGDTWYAYAVAKAGYTYTETSEQLPQSAAMTTEGGKFEPEATPNKIWVRYDRNGGGDAGRMDDSAFTYDEEAPLRLNSFARTCNISYNGNGGTAGQTSADSGFTFAGWSDRADGCGDYSYADGERVTNPCGSTGASENDPVLLYAQWTPKYVTLPTPLWTGHDFSGWYTKPEGGQRVGGAGQSYAAMESITLFAHWRAHVTKLTFVVDSQEKSEFAHEVVYGGKYGEFGSLPELTSNDPKTIFLGWYTEKVGGTQITDETEVNLTGDNAKLYAQWETVTWTITYVTNGGTINEYAKPGYSYGQAFSLPTDITRTGRTFLGWYDNQTFEGNPVAGISSTDTGDKTFYAKWSTVVDETVKLTFVNVTGYTTNNFEQLWEPVVDETTPKLTQEYKAGASVTLPQALFAQEGLTQIGWRLAGDGTTHPDKWTKYSMGKGLGTIAEDCTFHTIWETNTYTVIYNGNGGKYRHEESDGKWVMDDTWSLGYQYGVADRVMGTGKWTNTADRLTCVGWALTKKGHVVYTNGEQVVNLTAVNKGIVTLYAVWESNTVAAANAAKSAPKFAAASAVVPSPAIPAPTPIAVSSTLNSPLSTSQPCYTLHFSPGADVVNPMAMTNWENCVSSAAITPDCLYTNLYSDGFLGWIYNGETNTTIAPVAAFDGQIITVQAAWKSLSCGDLSKAVGLTNAKLESSQDSFGNLFWEPGKDQGNSIIRAVSIKDKSGTLNMQVCGSGTIKYCWKTNKDSAVASNVVDGAAKNIDASTNGWRDVEIEIDGDGQHQVIWFIPDQTGGREFRMKDVRWMPKRNYNLTTAVDPYESGTTGGDASYAVGTTASLSVQANPGYSFVQWNDGSTELTNNVTVWGDITNYVAMFTTKTHALTVAAVPAEGGSVKGNGIYPYGTQVEIKAVPSNDWVFVKWNNNETRLEQTVKVTGDVTYVALFTNVYEVSVTAEPEDYGKVTVEGGSCHAAGTTATVKATANSGYKFEYWSDGSTDVNHTITVLCATNLTATFSGSGPGPGPTPVTTNYYYIAFDGNGATNVVMDEQAGICGTNTVLCSNAFVRTGYTFVGWQDKNGKSYADGETVKDLATTNRAALLKAVWEPVKYLINFDSNGGSGKMSSKVDCSYGISYQLPECTFECAKMTFAGWATTATGGVLYADGAIVSNLSATGGVVTLYAVWDGHGQAFVNITGHTATKYYTGRPFTVSGYDVEIPSGGYYEKDFTTVPGTVTTLTETDVGEYHMNLSANSFSNLVPSVDVLFDVKEDGWLKIQPSQIGGEPGDRTVPAGGLSRFDATVEYGTIFDVTAISNDFAEAYGPCGIEYGALEGGPWSTDAPAFASIGTTSFWYRVTAANRNPFVHEVAVTVVARPIDKASVTIADQEWTGNPITPEAKVSVDEKELVEGTDYYLTYANNTDPGEATAYVHGKGNYTGMKAVTFKIVKKEPPHTLVTITGHTVTATYDGQAHTASGYDFVSTNADYTAVDFWCTAKTSVSRTEPGTTAANLTAADFKNFNDEFVVEFVVARDISVTITAGTIPGEPGSGTVPAGGLSKFDVTAVYDGQPHTVDATALLKAYADLYSGAAVTFGKTAGGPWGGDPISITDVGTTSFWYRVQAANYAPFVHATKVTVTPRDIADATVAPIPDQVVTGEPIEPEVTVTDGTPSIITTDDYDVAYSDNVAVGTATVTLTGKRNYTGTKTATFDIVEETKPGHYVSAYGETVSVDLQADFPDRTIKSVSGLPTGLKYNKSTGFVTGKSTKAVTEKKVTVTFTDRTKDYIYWTIKAGENHGVKIDFGAAATGEVSAMVGVGTAVEWTVTVAESGAKVTVSTLPTGLKYNKTTGLITGVPTKAKSFKMTVKTVVNGQTVTQTFDITVEPLPTMMVGTYYGAATVDGVAGQFQLKLAATGKATGYFYAAGKKISLKSTALEMVGEDAYSVTVTYTYNRAKCTDEILLTNAATVEDVDIWTATQGATSEVLDDLDARRDTIKENFGKVVSKTTSYDVMEKTEDGEYLKAKVTTAGAVTVSGKLLNNAATPKLTSVSCSTHLVVDDEGTPYCYITIYKTVSKSEPIVYDEVWYLPED